MKRLFLIFLALSFVNSGTAVLNAGRDNAEVTALLRAAISKDAGGPPLSR